MPAPSTPPPPLPLLATSSATTTSLATGAAQRHVCIEDDSLGCGDHATASTPPSSATTSTSTTAADDAGIDGFCAQGILVLDNRISGTGLAGIDVGRPGVHGPHRALHSGWQIIGNDVSGVTATGDQYGVSTAPDLARSRRYPLRGRRRQGADHGARPGHQGHLDQRDEACRPARCDGHADELAEAAKAAKGTMRP